MYEFFLNAAPHAPALVVLAGLVIFLVRDHSKTTAALVAAHAKQTTETMETFRSELKETREEDRLRGTEQFERYNSTQKYLVDEFMSKADQGFSIQEKMVDAMDTQNVLNGEIKTVLDDVRAELRKD